MDLFFGSLLYVLYTFDYFLKVLLEKSQFLVLPIFKKLLLLSVCVFL